MDFFLYLNKYISLNCDIVNGYLQVLKQTNFRSHATKTEFADSNLYNFLERNNLERLNDWNVVKNFFNLDMVVVPINLGKHWVMAIFMIPEKKIYFFNSLIGKNIETIDEIQIYFGVFLKKVCKLEEISQWSFINVDKVPKQDNAHDCGVFVCAYVESALSKTSFFQVKETENSVSYRMLMAHRILEYSKQKNS